MGGAGWKEGSTPPVPGAGPEEGAVAGVGVGAAGAGAEGAGDVGVPPDVAVGLGLAVAVGVTAGVDGGAVVAVGEAARRTAGLSPSPPPTRTTTPTAIAISTAVTLPRANPFQRHGRLQASLNHRAATESAARKISAPRSLATCRDYTPALGASPRRSSGRPGSLS